MMDGYNKNGANAEGDASFLSLITGAYLDNIFSYGCKTELKPGDLGGNLSGNRASFAYDLFHRYWLEEAKSFKESNKSKINLFWPLLRALSLRRLLLSIFLFAMSVIFQFGPVAILYKLLCDVSDKCPTNPSPYDWYLVALLFILPVAGSLCFFNSNRIVMHLAVQTRNALVMAIYRKSLRLTVAAQQSNGGGVALSLFSEDTNQIRSFIVLLNSAVVAPFQILGGITLLYFFIGPIALAGFVVILVVLPINGSVFRAVGKMRESKLEASDERNKLIHDVINGIRTVKLYCWEKAMMAKIGEVRERELSWILRMGLLFNTCFAMFFSGLPNFQNVLLFGLFLVTNHALDQAMAIGVIVIYALMLQPFMLMPAALQQYSQACSAAERIASFLLEEEQEPYVTELDLAATPTGSPAAVKDVIRLVSFSSLWRQVARSSTDKTLRSTTRRMDSKSSSHIIGRQGSVNLSAGEVGGAIEIDLDPAESFAGGKMGNRRHTSPVQPQGAAPFAEALSRIDLVVKEGALVAVVGGVGSGKTSLLLSILGELFCNNGSLSILPGKKIAYCDQKPCIVNGSLLRNITFGLEYNEEKVNRAVDAACMKDDIALFPRGIETMLVDQGSSLSGGQKARLAIARAVYADADIYLFDDALSALDASVALHIFEHGIVEALRDKTRIMVTQSLQVLRMCNSIVVLEDGQIKIEGSFDDILTAGVDIQNYLPEESFNESSRNRSLNTNSKSRRRGENSRSVSNVVRDDVQLHPSESESNSRSHSRSHTKMVRLDDPPMLMPAAGFHNTGQDEVGVALPSGTIRDKYLLPDTANTSNSRVFFDKNGVSGGKKIVEEGKLFMTGQSSVAVAPTEEIRPLECCDNAENNWENYSILIASGGWAIFAAAVGFSVVNQVLTILAMFTLSHWARDAEIQNDDEINQAKNRASYFRYTIMLLCGVLCIVGIRVTITYHRIYSARNLHSQLLRKVLNTKIGFFDVTPVGEIMNKFAHDMAVITEDMTYSFFLVVGMGGICIGALAGIVSATGGIFLIFLVPLAVAAYVLAGCFTASNNSISRMVAATRAPVYSCFAEMLDGSVTIRSYGKVDDFIRQTEDTLDVNTIPEVYQSIANLWITQRLEILTAITLAIIGALAVNSPPHSNHESFFNIDSQNVGIGMYFGILLSLNVKVIVNLLSTGQTQMNAIENCCHYIKRLTSEQPRDFVGLVEPSHTRSGSEDSASVSLSSTMIYTALGAGKLASHVRAKAKFNKSAEVAPQPATATLPSGWPRRGKIEFRNVCLSYRNGPQILHSTSLTVHPRQHVGICGRSGSGKSSLMAALFRMEELTSGQILIDDIDIATVDLATLRSKLCIIPQDPVLFNASVRFNLDPLCQFSDRVIWDVLNKIGMEDVIKKLPRRLDEVVAQGGRNFSYGQRQLLCIARALLKRPRILVMDEATSCVDNVKGSYLQQLKTNRFESSTVISIAHSLDRIVNFDKIVVMDSGVVREEGPATELMKVEDGMFRQLWEKQQEELRSDALNEQDEGLAKNVAFNPEDVLTPVLEEAAIATLANNALSKQADGVTMPSHGGVPVNDS